MTDWPAILTASASVLTVSGGGIAFVWNKVERGLKDVKTELEECRKREAESSKREADLLVQVRETAAKHITVIELLLQEVERRSRGAPNAVLARVRQLLDDLKEDAKP